jgi:hypothetical protein
MEEKNVSGSFVSLKIACRKCPWVIKSDDNGFTTPLNLRALRRFPKLRVNYGSERASAGRPTGIAPI